jgi:hypothetical protein
MKESGYHSQIGIPIPFFNRILAPTRHSWHTVRATFMAPTTRHSWRPRTHLRTVGAINGVWVFQEGI